MNIFEEAAKRKLRFESVKGALTVEQLFDLPLTSDNNFNLRAIGQHYLGAITKTKVSDFLTGEEVKATLDDELRLSILSHIRDTRKNELDERQNAAANKRRREQLLAVLAEKENEKLKNMTSAQIEEELAKLGS
jgi:hypothetical protein